MWLQKLGATARRAEVQKTSTSVLRVWEVSSSSGSGMGRLHSWTCFRNNFSRAGRFGLVGIQPNSFSLLFTVIGHYHFNGFPSVTRKPDTGFSYLTVDSHPGKVYIPFVWLILLSGQSWLGKKVDEMWCVLRPWLQGHIVARP